MQNTINKYAEIQLIKKQWHRKNWLYQFVITTQFQRHNLQNNIVVAASDFYNHVCIDR